LARARAGCDGRRRDRRPLSTRSRLDLELPRDHGLLRADLARAARGTRRAAVARTRTPLHRVPARPAIAERRLPRARGPREPHATVVLQHRADRERLGRLASRDERLARGRFGAARGQVAGVDPGRGRRVPPSDLHGRRDRVLGARDVLARGTRPAPEGAALHRRRGPPPRLGARRARSGDRVHRAHGVLRRRSRGAARGHAHDRVHAVRAPADRADREPRRRDHTRRTRGVRHRAPPRVVGLAAGHARRTLEEALRLDLSDRQRADGDPVDASVAEERRPAARQRGVQGAGPRQARATDGSVGARAVRLDRRFGPGVGRLHHERAAELGGEVLHRRAAAEAPRLRGAGSARARRAALAGRSADAPASHRDASVASAAGRVAVDAELAQGRADPARVRRVRIRTGGDRARRASEPGRAGARHAAARRRRRRWRPRALGSVARGWCRWCGGGRRLADRARCGRTGAAARDPDAAGHVVGGSAPAGEAARPRSRPVRVRWRRDPATGLARAPAIGNGQRAHGTPAALSRHERRRVGRVQRRRSRRHGPSRRRGHRYRGPAGRARGRARGRDVDRAIARCDRCGADRAARARAALDLDQRHLAAARQPIALRDPPVVRHASRPEGDARARPRATSRPRQADPRHSCARARTRSSQSARAATIAARSSSLASPCRFTKRSASRRSTAMQ
jgi:hypothetical protein